MKYRIAVWWGLVLLPVLLQAQFIEQYRVMAKSGLRLRSAASREAKVIDVVPYGDTVDVVFPADMRYLSNDQYLAYTRQWVVDTAGVAFTRNHYSGNDTRMTKPEPHIGYWWPASYAGQTGYLFSGFLWPVDIAGSEEAAFRIKELSGDYRLRREGGSGCSSNQIEWDTSFRWYALTVQNGSCRLEKTGVQSLAMSRCIQIGCEGDYPGWFVYIRSDSRRSPCYLIGSKDTLPERRFKGFCRPADSVAAPNYWYSGVDTSAWLIYPNGLVNTALLQASGLQLVLEKTFRHGALYDWYAVGRHGKRQKLEHHIDQLWADGQLHPTLYQPFRLCFSGDLDGDRQTDYIVAFTHRGQLLENSYSGIYLKLYLSSVATGSEVVHPVAILGEFDCG